MQINKLQYVSNIYKKYPGISKVRLTKVSWKPTSPNLALCGNIGDATDKEFVNFIDTLSKDYDNVFMVAGPIEYHNNMKEAQIILKGMESYIPNFHFMNNKTYNIDGTTIIGSTMWPAIDSMSFIYSTDISKIKVDKEYMTPKKINSLHKLDKDFIETTLQDEEITSAIVMTHFNPSKSFNSDAIHSYIPKQAMNNFASNLEYMFQPPIKKWICGAINMSDTIEINGIPLSCNNLI